MACINLHKHRIKIKCILNLTWSPLLDIRLLLIRKNIILRTEKYGHQINRLKNEIERKVSMFKNWNSCKETEND